MRGVRSLIVLLVIAIPLGWYAWRDAQRPAGSDEADREKVFAVEADQIEEIAITSDAGERTTLRKSGGDWRIVAPTEAAPDSTEVSGLTRNLATLELQRVVDENAPDLGEYGLAEPRIEVAFKAGGEEHRLLIGDKTPPGTDLYAKRAADDAVFTIASYLESTFNRSTFELRDKAALKVERDKVETVEVSAGGRTLRFTKASGEWQMSAPMQARADYGAVEGLVGRVGGLQMRSIVQENGAAGKFGLEQPSATISLGTGSSQATLALGASAGEGAVYARDLARPAIFTVDASLLDDVKKAPSDFRQKDLFDARSFNTTRVEIQRGGSTHVFEKSTTKNDEGQAQEVWRQLSPQERTLEGETFDKLLSAITGARATGFVDEAPRALSTPELTVTLHFDEKQKQERVSFGLAGDAAFAARDGEPGAARLDRATLEAITAALQELK